MLRGGHWRSHLEHDWRSPVWRPLLERLGSGRLLARYDPRGTGLSERRPEAWDIGPFANDLEAVADAAGLERFPVFAASQSAAIALDYAAPRVERISGLVLLGGFAQGSLMRGERERSEAMFAMIRTGWGVRGALACAPSRRCSWPRGRPRRSRASSRCSAAPRTPRPRPRCAISQIEITADLPHICAPALMLHASRDAIQPVEPGRPLA